ncbi:MAG: HPr family phosphocarrier protein, partial [Candidatus Vogelbacteria bacterium]|nr:HPr family phosphocarrier protein [Candidatus Vogelbacteria bacterium]
MLSQGPSFRLFARVIRAAERFPHTQIQVTNEKTLKSANARSITSPVLLDLKKGSVVSVVAEGGAEADRALAAGVIRANLLNPIGLDGAKYISQKEVQPSASTGSARAVHEKVETESLFVTLVKELLDRGIDEGTFINYAANRMLPSPAQRAGIEGVLDSHEIKTQAGLGHDFTMQMIQTYRSLSVLAESQAVNRKPSEKRVSAEEGARVASLGEPASSSQQAGGRLATTEDFRDSVKQNIAYLLDNRLVSRNQLKTYLTAKGITENDLIHQLLPKVKYRSPLLKISPQVLLAIFPIIQLYRYMTSPVRSGTDLFSNTLPPNVMLNIGTLTIIFYVIMLRLQGASSYSPIRGSVYVNSWAKSQNLPTHVRHELTHL